MYFDEFQASRKKVNLEVLCFKIFQIEIKQNGRPFEKGIDIDFGRNLENLNQLRERLAEEISFTNLENVRFYSQDGKEIFDDDLFFLNSGDIIYFEPNGIKNSFFLF
jgi:hypothetical protein